MDSKVMRSRDMERRSRDTERERTKPRSKNQNQRTSKSKATLAADKVIMPITTGAMGLGKWTKGAGMGMGMGMGTRTRTGTGTGTRTRTSMMVIRPCSDGDLEKVADDETASGTVGDKGTHNSFSGSGMLRTVEIVIYYTLSIRWLL
jgi:hypothetical protein